jgi:threonylcarbamoyladenosine tRNA methylthiotransferase MtaB
LNQAETAMLAGLFERRGYRLVDADVHADVAVVHTCTVTGRSDAKCRQAVHHALMRNPDVTVIVAGCYSQVAAEELSRIDGVDYVLGTEDKFRLFDHFSGPGKIRPPKVVVTALSLLRKSPAYATGFFGGRTRAFLKIQSGCGRNCTYCIVPSARGPGRSEAPDDVLNNAETLVRGGFREIVVTGTHIGDYGKEGGKGLRLSELLERLLSVEGLDRLRLSSLDPDEVTDELLATVASHERICRHFHVSLQSGSDAILRKMNRRYTAAEFRGIVEKIAELFDSPGIGTDVITGFPGETDECFSQTVELVESLPFSYIHVFPFSPRRGTPAESMPGQVPSALRIERAQALREVGVRKRKAFAEKWIGKTVSVLMEGGKENGRMSGITSEYLRVETAHHPELSNRIVSVIVEKVMDKGAYGRMLST